MKKEIISNFLSEIGRDGARSRWANMTQEAREAHMKKMCEAKAKKRAQTHVDNIS